MWQVRGTVVNPSWLTLQPHRVLYSYDGPRIFTCRDAAENQYLAYLCDEDDAFVRFVVAPCDEWAERELTTGMVDVQEVLSRYRSWIFDLNHDWQPVRAWRIDPPYRLPAGVLPNPGVMLWRHLPSRISQASFRPAADTTELPPFLAADFARLIAGQNGRYYAEVAHA